MKGGLASRGRRLIAAAIAVIIGTAFLTTSLVVLATAQAGLEDTVAAGIRDADLVVTPQMEGLGAADSDAVAALPGIDRVEPHATVFVEVGQDYATGGTQPGAGSALLEGRLPQEPGEIAVTRSTADSGVAVGDTFTVAQVTYDSGEDRVEVPLSVVGVIEPGELGPMSWGKAFLTTDATLRQLDRELFYEDLRLHLTDGASLSTVRAEVEAAVPDALVRTGPEEAEAQVDAMTDDTPVMAAILLGFGAVALVTAAIVIANTFTITLAQRAGELALLRCVGATKRQVRRLVLLEALVLGLVASAVGILLGLGLAGLLLVLARRLDLGVPLATGLSVGLLAVLVPLLAGTVITLLAALLPAARATRISPLAALRPSGSSSERARVPWLRVGVGVVAFALGTALMVYAATHREMLAGVAGGVVSFAGVLLAAVALVPLAVRALGLGPRVAGVPGRLAVDNAVRNPGRAAATSAALLVGVTLITMTTIGAATGEHTAMGEIDDAYAVDVAASGSWGYDEETGMQVPQDLSADVAAQLAGVDGVAQSHLVPTAYLSLGSADWQTGVVVLDEGAAGVMRSAAQLESLRPGTVGLSNLGQTMVGAEVGDTISVFGPGGSRDLEVVQLGLGEMSAVTVDDLGGLAGDQVADSVLLMRLDPRADVMKTMEQLHEIAGPAGATLGGSATERAVITQVLDVLVLVTVALLGVAVAIAVVGIANTLSLSVIERHREHALLRGLGLTRGQLRGMLLIEGILLAVVSALIGLGLGLLYAWLGVQTVLPEDIDVRLGIPWARVGMILGVALLAGILASVLPARRAARVSPAQGLAAA